MDTMYKEDGRGPCMRGGNENVRGAWTLYRYKLRCIFSEAENILKYRSLHVKRMLRCISNQLRKIQETNVGYLEGYLPVDLFFFW